MRKKIILLCLILAVFTSCKNTVTENPDPVSPETLREGFINPPDSVKPWVYWYWISDNNTKEGITKDLEAMAEVGIGEALIGNIGYEGMPYGEIKTLSEEWWQLIEHAVREGKRTGVNIGLFNSPGWSQSGGPWVKPEQAMRYLVSSETIIEGGKSIIQKLEKPAEIFQDVRVLAFPLPENDGLTLASLKPSIRTSPRLKDVSRLSDGDKKTICSFRDAGNAFKLIIDYESAGSFTARSLTMIPAGIEFSADVELQIPDNGIYKSVRKFRYDRSNSRVNVGPMPNGPVTVSFPETTSKSFRIILSNFSLSNYFSGSAGSISGAALAELEISAAPRLESYVEKQLGKMCQTPFPLWYEYQWKTQKENGSEEMNIDPAGVIDISNKLAGDTLTWDAPEGKWLVLRTGATLTGTQNAQAAPHAIGLEVDKMNREHLRKHFDQYVGELLKRIPPEERTALKHVVLDSYEQGSQNWTDDMIEDFRKKYDYDPVPWLPVLSGRIVGSADQSDRFLWDLRRLVADRIAYDYVGGFRDICQENGLKIWLENYGHWGFPSEFLMYGGQSHDIAGEFWNEGELGNIECRAASSAVHTYGKRLVSAESYTSAGLAFQRYPAFLKKRGDWSYTEGINQVILHLYIQQPWEDKNPGINAWFGTEFNRKNTWFAQSKNWIDYQRRCMFMLRRGLPVNDVCYFIGEDAPKMTGTRIPELPKGYSFDYINAEVILNRLSVSDGKLMLPDGMSYRLLVLPPLETMRPELLEKIKLLVEQGAAVYGPPPSRTPGMKDYPEADTKVKQLASELWNTGNSGTNRNSVIMNNIELKDALDNLAVEPDVVFTGDVPLLWIHRRLDNSEIYFITNQSDNKINFNATFRVTGKQPELWDPLDGSIRDLKAFSIYKNGTEIPLELESQGSAFIVFREDPKNNTGPGNNFPEPDILVKIDTPWEVTFDQKKGGPAEPVTMTILEDWTKNTDERIKYYSGTASYKNSFALSVIPSDRQLLIKTGKADVMAEVKINGQLAGGVWTDPWKINITGLVKEGVNTVEILVVNNWINRLIGDIRLPAEKRTTWVNENPAKPGDKLQPSGLTGPVLIESVRY